MAEQAYASLKRDIIRCHLRPGDVIVEAWLAERYGMSKTPVREAINALRREGLVVVVPRRGTFVKPTDLGDLQDTYRLRRLLEPEAAVLASQRAGAEDLDRLGALSAATVAANASRPDLNEANRLLHVAIAEVARVSLMIPMINTLHEEIERFLNLRGNSAGLPTQASTMDGWSRPSGRARRKRSDRSSSKASNARASTCWTPCCPEGAGRAARRSLCEAPALLPGDREVIGVGPGLPARREEVEELPARHPR